MYKTIFEAAKNYDIETIKKYVEDGNESINQINEEGQSLFYEWLVAYYDKNNYAPGGYRWNEVNIEDYYQSGYPLLDWQKMPLEERKYSIKDDLDWFVSKGVDFNLAKRNQKEDNVLLLPIYQTIIVLDYPMMVYLIEHGAIPYTHIPFCLGETQISYYNELMDWLDCEIMYCYPSKEAENHIKKMMKYLEEHRIY